MLAGPFAADSRIEPSSRASRTPHTLRRRWATLCFASKNGLADAALLFPVPAVTTFTPDPSSALWGRAACAAGFPAHNAKPRLCLSQTGAELQPFQQSQAQPGIAPGEVFGVKCCCSCPLPRRLELDQGGRPDSVRG